MAMAYVPGDPGAPCGPAGPWTPCWPGGPIGPVAPGGPLNPSRPSLPDKPSVVNRRENVLTGFDLTLHHTNYLCHL